MEDEDVASAGSTSGGPRRNNHRKFFVALVICVSVAVSIVLVGFGLFVALMASLCNYARNCVTYVNGHPHLGAHGQLEMGFTIAVIGVVCLLGTFIWGITLVRRGRRLLVVLLTMGGLAATVFIVNGPASPGGVQWGLAALVFFVIAGWQRLSQNELRRSASRNRSRRARLGSRPGE